MSHNFAALREHIISLSESQEWSEAIEEWKLFGFEYNKNWDSCPCGQPIKEMCFLVNTKNGNRTHVGNVCVNTWLGIETGNLFEGLARIRKNSEASPNMDLITHAKEYGYIYDSEYDFLVGIRHKRNKSYKQLKWIQKINYRILNKTVVTDKKNAPSA